ncbi:MAG: four-carbon acid sugar kinase family protein [Caldilineaceae bacterium]
MTLLLILADDLTGAADAAAHAYDAGLSATVLVRPEAPAFLPVDGAVAINSASRALPAAAARQRVARLVQGILDGPGRGRDDLIWFKKIDSQLRGQVGAEVRAMAQALGRGLALVTPALPHLGRTVQGGHLMDGSGRPGLAVSPRLGLRSSAATAAAVEDGARFAEEVARGLRQSRGRGVRVMVCDAAHDGHLDTIAGVAVPQQSELLAAGSGALAGALARQIAAADGARPMVAQASWQGEQVVAVIGSRSERARRQVARAAACPRVVWLQGDALAAPTPAGCRGLLLTPDTPADKGSRIDPAHAQNLAAGAASHVEGGGFTRLVVGGGATAEALLLRLGVDALEGVALADVGMPLLRPFRAEGGAAALPDMVLKPGNHGDADLLRRWLCDAADG